MLQFDIRVTIHEKTPKESDSREFDYTTDLEDKIINDILLTLEHWDFTEYEDWRKFGLTISLVDKVR